MGNAVIRAGEGDLGVSAADRAVCARGRTVLVSSFEPAHDLGLCACLLFELHTLVCGSLAGKVAVKNAIVAIARCV